MDKRELYPMKLSMAPQFKVWKPPVKGESSLSSNLHLHPEDG